MTHGVDRFSLRVAVALTKHRETATVLPGGVVGEPSTGTLGALRDMFNSFARPDELDPLALVIGLDCSNSDPTGISSDIAGDARDVLALYSDHLFVVCNPGLGAGLLQLLKLMVGGLGKRTADKDIPHYRVSKEAVEGAVLSGGRPGWSPEYGEFIRIDTRDRQIWFWSELLVDSEGDVRNVLVGLTPGATASA